ncbi:MAG: tetrahydromethanopterin S-methyltransferase subunit [Methanolobus sp.]|jgi:tetrahydromethanopterin S-methyltransferase subunit H|uniref:Tetrahydromethanopterin S-methyltransferase, subunit H n=1 Tax=Methanolobus tindarius DSM 2278 TaxID=1090322 RepID=W9DVB1_METTI|nr:MULTISPECIES: tetrahydromethanopterin S-methyltransferase subunit H [Methanolobus]ETA67592.1 tetrahydromethanopterin S-methyltransferase, subunit H [Methanolobus tindarius DSM 2278]MDI3485374.1 tetrahydromethanopterin S-methyltransferase subunit [Methanolobus sp.]MDK2831742.1 tetrahydromethanopterin S-methyltransferase subunit [Methanolobus sp.]MDK2939344.1 tetrahydromethanopterin S-methyltransferase subunit [Methanolobus sp.]
MFKFDKKQEVYDVGGVKFGGQPGQYPTVLIGTMFYNRHKIVTDEDKGVFDVDAANKLWQGMVDMGEVTGNPIVNQIVGETPEAIKKYIDWFVEVDDKTPFLIDSSAGDVRAAAAEYVTEIGVADRAIYNSINASVHADEIEAIRESDITASIVLAFNATDPSVKGKLEILENGGTGQEKGMLEIAKECGITKPLIDVAATPLGAGSGASMRAVIAIKGHLGLPVGGGYHNMASAWDWMKAYKKQFETREEKQAIYMPADIGTNLVPQILGSNFQLFGPIENTDKVFPATAMVDIMLAETAKELGLEIMDENHPINKLV